jgi:hypothetical protein
MPFAELIESLFGTSRQLGGSAAIGMTAEGTVSIRKPYRGRGLHSHDWGSQYEDLYHPESDRGGRAGGVQLLAPATHQPANAFHRVSMGVTQHWTFCSPEKRSGFSMQAASSAPKRPT